MNNKKNIPGFLLSALAAVLFLQPAATFALTDLEKCQNEKTALELELQRQGDKVKAKIEELEAETQKKQEQIDAQLADKEKELSDVKAEVDTAKKEADEAKKEADAAKKEADAAKKESDAAKKEAETAKKNAADNDKRLKDLQQSCSDREKALQDRIKQLEAQLQEQNKGQSGQSADTGDDATAREKELLARIKELEDQKSQDGLQNKSSDIDKDMSTQYDKEKIATLEAAIEDLNAQLEECKDHVRSQKERIDRLESQKRDFKQELDGEIKDGDIRMPDSKGEKRIIININDRISFDPGSATLKRNIYPTLNKISKVLKNYPEHKILVAGHTDSDPITRSNFKDNEELSEARANAVLDYLLKNTNLDQSRFKAKGFGEKRPVAKNNTAANKALNRRVDIIVVTAERDIPDDTEDTENTEE